MVMSWSTFERRRRIKAGVFMWENREIWWHWGGAAAVVAALIRIFVIVFDLNISTTTTASAAGGNEGTFGRSNLQRIVPFEWLQEEKEEDVHSADFLSLSPLLRLFNPISLDGLPIALCRRAIYWSILLSLLGYAVLFPTKWMDTV